jgi:ABC-2 type transport system permease protein
LSEFEKLKVVTRYELLKQFRRKRFYGALALAIVVTVLTIALYKGFDLHAAMGLPDSPELFAVFVSRFGSMIAILAAVFFAGDSIAGEFERKTGYILFPNPVRRSTLVVGKYLACFIATVTILILANALAAAVVAGAYPRVPAVEMLKSLGLMLAFACSMLGLTFLFSSLLKGSMGAVIVPLLLVMLIFPIIRTSLEFAGHEPWFMLDYAGEAMIGVYGLQFPGARVLPDPTTSFFVMLVYFAIPFVLSIWLTKRREML